MRYYCLKHTIPNGLGLAPDIELLIEGNWSDILTCANCQALRSETADLKLKLITEGE